MQYIMLGVLLKRRDKMAQNVFLFRNSKKKNLFLQFFTIVFLSYFFNFKSLDEIKQIDVCKANI